MTVYFVHLNKVYSEMLNLPWPQLLAFWVEEHRLLSALVLSGKLRASVLTSTLSQW
jgi:hypothetical protein